jgi:replicative DNA helicase
MSDQVDSEDQLFKKFQQNREAQQRLAAEGKELERQAKERGFNFDGADGSHAKPSLTSAVDLLDKYLAKLKSGDLPQLYRFEDVLDGIEVGGGLITLIGAPPGAGKTAMASQLLFEAMQLQPQLVGYLANAEMAFDSIIRRELTRLTRVKSDAIRFGLLTQEEHYTIDMVIAGLRASMERLQVFEEPDHERLLELLDKPPGFVVIDYLQKFAPPDKDVRVGVNTVMNTLRRLANHGHGILALSATKRDTKGQHSSESLGLSSFKESGECEFQADSAYVLRDIGPAGKLEYIRHVELAHVKNRHGAKVDRHLEFHMPKMRFSHYDDIGAAAAEELCRKHDAKRHSEFDEYEVSDDAGPRGNLAEVIF